MLTVRKWLRRYKQHGPSGLAAVSRARHHQAQKIPPTTEAQFVELRKTLPTFGSRRLIHEFDLPISHRALKRIWRQHGLLKNARRNISANQRRYQGLDDIPRYWAQAQCLLLPIVQYTAREIPSGLLFWAFAQQRSAAASAVFASRIQRHLDSYGVSLPDLVWQTGKAASSRATPGSPRRQPARAHPAAAHTYAAPPAASRTHMPFARASPPPSQHHEPGERTACSTF